VTDKFVTRREFDRERQHIRELLSKEQRALEIKQAADDKAQLLAYQERAKKDASQNEWRGESSDRAAAYVTRSELKPIQDWVLAQQGRSAGISALQATLMGLALLATAVLSVALAMGR
jgi:hypothetical protein